MSFCNLAQLILPILDENADTTAHDWMGASAREMLAELLLELNRPSEALRSTKQLCVSLRIGLTLSMERRVLSPRRAKQTMPRPIMRRIETRDGPHSAPPFENARLLGSLVRQNPPSLSVAEEATAAGRRLSRWGRLLRGAATFQAEVCIAAGPPAAPSPAQACTRRWGRASNLGFGGRFNWGAPSGPSSFNSRSLIAANSHPTAMCQYCWARERRNLRQASASWHG
jgi:hypothetical protein